VKVRSAGLAILGAALLVAAGVLGAILVHDGETAAAPLAAAQPGDEVALKGVPTEFHPSGPLGAWQPLRPLLGEHTYEMPAADGAVALVTSDDAAPGDVVLAEGTVAFVGPHPDGSGRMLVLVAVHAWREPFLFR
jgi:hypothetical protein